MPSLEQRLAAGLEAQDWRETASRGPWRRWAKFGRGAMYVLPSHTKPGSAGLYFSELHIMEPQDMVVGPIYDNVLAAGDKQLAQQAVDTQGLLIELLYAGKPNGGSDGA